MEGWTSGHLCFEAEHESQRTGREVACKPPFCLQAVSVGLLSQGAEGSGGRLWEEIPVQLRGGLSSLLEARQLINSQLARCFLSKVDIFLSVFLSYQQYNISEDRKL